MFHGYNAFRGWIALAALVPVLLVLSYATEPAVRRAGYWGDGWRDRPLAERVHLLPQDAVPSLRRELGSRRAVSKVEPASDSQYVVQDLQEAIDGLPESVRRLVEDRLVGIYLVKGLGAGENAHNLGMALEVIGLWRQHVGTVILIDRDETDMRANRAMAGMEYVPSGDFRGVTVQARLARRDADNRATTLRYVLLHELGHLIDFDRGITPSRFRYGAQRADCGFTCLSWINRDRHRYSQRIDSAMKQVRAGQYEAYAAALPETFRHLGDTDFPSFYAATLPEEDFAESFAQYVHAVMLNQPWELTLRVDGTIKARLAACFLDRRCPEKKAYFDALLVGAGR